MSYCIALDLNDTIISSTSLLPPSEHFFKIKIPSIRRYIFIQLRPGLKSFIKEILKNEIGIFVFTSQPKKIANPIIDFLVSHISQTINLCSNDKLSDHGFVPQFIPQNHRFFKEDCIIENGYYVKDLSLISNLKNDKYYPINNIFLVDDMQGNALRQPHNLIKIKPWYGNEDNDNELLGYILPAILNKINKNAKVNHNTDDDCIFPNSSNSNGIGVKRIEQAFCNEMSVI